MPAIQERYLQTPVMDDLKDKMVFVGGPRQVGKTTLAKQVGREGYAHASYLNWDNQHDKKTILQGRWESDADLLILDEIHKYKRWKSWVKGEYDNQKDRFNILITGSARLDLYRKGGDSLMGRYHYYRLHPFSVVEMLHAVTDIEPMVKLRERRTAGARDAFETLFYFGGFPEPLFKGDHRSLRRFHNERTDRLVREDIRDVELVRDLSLMQVLVDLLPSKVGSLLSLNALREDLSVNHKTVARWVNILEHFYYHFRIYPYVSHQFRSLKKEPKCYLWDWSQNEDEAARLENMVASHLLKTLHFLEDKDGHKGRLYFVRDKQGHEVDFLVTVGRKIWFAVEVKWSEKEVSKHLRYFREKLQIPYAYQVVHSPGVDFLKEHVRVLSADKFLTFLPC